MQIIIYEVEYIKLKTMKLISISFTNHTIQPLQFSMQFHIRRPNGSKSPDIVPKYHNKLLLQDDNGPDKQSDNMTFRISVIGNTE